ncbi:MAG: sulfite exporter TauE/SafE family protein [Boseongicola sp. SB0664_bin_43]|uniref:Probable membrane transporter protein n=1 Tax=Boseongicola sp. SB0664_bin_43 TaxID=2604844 RepID=A0A6B0Y6L4_9RHOB|nr:sulfite exporter TauE/SafE family protein [Boseongicola sp. SB0664_bin_43]MYK31372.1 sulfite exporter TauE/SafE family protein [Boseongicola sp. SB0670_bin_30]
MDPNLLLFATAAILLGGFLKGATGAGAPVVGVPILAAIFDVQFAVAVFSVLNLFSNIWHSYAYRKYRGPFRLVYGFAIAGSVGAIAGSVLLASLPTDALMASLAGIVLAYILLRLFQPGWVLDRSTGMRLVPYVGMAGGLMQGAGGISAPVSVTFLNAMRLPRAEFIATISVFFVTMSIVQIPSLAYLGILTIDRSLMAMAAAVPLFLSMPVGEWAARHMSKVVFDRIILILLAAIAVRLIWTSMT